MKPVSIIFLIVGLVLIIAGFIVAGVASDNAEKENIMLLSDKSEDGQSYTFREYYSNENITGIKIDVNDAEINIIGGSDKAYAELVNFRGGTYELSGERTLTISNSTGKDSVDNIFSMVKSFKGLHGFLDYMRFSGEGKKIINIHVCDGNSIKNIECNSKDGAVRVTNMKADCNYSVNLTKGNFWASGIETDELVTVNIKEGNVIIESGRMGSFKVDDKKGNLKAKSVEINTVDVKLGAGNAEIRYKDAIPSADTTLYTGQGLINYAGEEKGNNYIVEDDSLLSKLKIQISTGNIKVKAE